VARGTPDEGMVAISVTVLFSQFCRQLVMSNALAYAYEIWQVIGHFIAYRPTRAIVLLTLG
jgi:Na+-translocating ferredoxin:NAD+ oxidoreductase RnfE subunit